MLNLRIDKLYQEPNIFTIKGKMGFLEPLIQEE